MSTQTSQSIDMEALYSRVSVMTVKKTKPAEVYVVNPLEDPRWDEFLAWHPRASLFHTSAWLRSLAITYGYRPIAYTTCGPDEPLRNAAVFCEVNSWLTGERLVSLPFSDHCEWLVDEKDDTRAICAHLERSIETRSWRYIELRPIRPIGVPVWLSHSQVRYTLHMLDLRPNLETIFANFHQSSIQRKIRRAEREGLVYCEGSSELLLSHFYRLLQITRRRHRLPAQPRRWFSNLLRCFGDDVKIRVALKDGRPVAAMMTIRNKDTMVYKYGCSDARFNRCGSMHLLFWNAIQEAKSAGLQCFDFGRTDADQNGLITFKGRWGATESVLDYSRYSAAASSSTHLFDLRAGSWKSNAAKFVLSHLPSGVLDKVGQVLYGHIG